MADKQSEVDKMKRWAEAVPAPDGPIPDGDLATHLGATRLVAILMDDRGRAYHISNLNLNGAQLARLEQPRTAINQLMDAYNVHDGPNWSDVRD